MSGTTDQLVTVDARRRPREPRGRVIPLGYIVRRTSLLFLTVVIALTLNFAIPRLIPGDPVEQALSVKVATSGSQSTDVQALAEIYRAKFGLDKSILTQYYYYWNDIAHGDLGVSLVNFPERVSHQIKGALPWTIGLLMVSTLIAFVVGSLLGGLLAWPRAPRSLHVFIPGLMLFSVIPYFLLAILLVYFFAMRWRVLPPAGGYSPTAILGVNWSSAADIARHALLPGFSIVLGSLALWALSMRGTMVSVLGEDYITLAEAKGLKPRRIFLWYGMRNAILPQVTLLAIALGFILSGAVLVEVIFSYPGVGSLLYRAIQTKDYFVIQGIVLMLILSLAVALFVVDLLYPFLDPRIRYHRR